MSEREDPYRQADYHKPQPSMPDVPNINDPVLKELRELRREVEQMFRYTMWVALGFSLLFLFLMFKL